MQLQRQKDSGKINYCNVNQGNVNNFTIATLNSDTDFQKYLKVKFLALLSSKKQRQKRSSKFFFNFFFLSPINLTEGAFNRNIFIKKML